MGWRSLLGGSPFANSMAVMPRDHMSAYGVRGRGDQMLVRRVLVQCHYGLFFSS